MLWGHGVRRTNQTDDSTVLYALRGPWFAYPHFTAEGAKAACALGIYLHTAALGCEPAWPTRGLRLGKVVPPGDTARARHDMWEPGLAG